MKGINALFGLVGIVGIIVLAIFLSGDSTSGGTNITVNTYVVNGSFANMSTLDDNRTQFNQFNGDNTTQANLITGNNNTLNNKITSNNNTLTNAINLKAGTGDCGTGFVVQNTTTGGVQCVPVSVGASGTYNDTITNATESNDNTTQANAINTKVNITDFISNNNTVYGALGGKTNLSTNTATCGAGTVAQNVTLTNGVVSTQCVTATATGGYNDTTINATQSSDNTTLFDLINTKANYSQYFSNNNTVYASLGLKVNLTASASLKCTSGEYIDNVTTVGGVVTSIVCKNQSSSSDNTTLTDLIGTKANQTEFVNTNTTIYVRINADNTTQANLTDLTNANNTIYADLGKKVNLTASSSVQCSSGEYLGNVTILGGLITVSKCFNQSGSSDNTTLFDLINTKANLTDLTNANNTIYGSLGQKVNQTEYTNNNATIVGLIGTKVNNTGGSYIGNFTLLGLFNITPRVADTNNITFTINDSIFFNRSQSGYLGFRTSSPNSWLEIGGNFTLGGTLFLEGVNVSGRIISNNNTLLGLIGTKVNITDLTSANNTIYGSLGQKVNITDANSNNNTIYASLGQKANLTDLTSNNNTIYASLGQKLNLTGGTLSGALNLSAQSYYYFNRTIYEPSSITGSDNQNCEIHRGIQLNYTRCFNTTGQVVETIGVFPV